MTRSSRIRSPRLSQEEKLSSLSPRRRPRLSPSGSVTFTPSSFWELSFPNSSVTGTYTAKLSASPPVTEASKSAPAVVPAI